MKPMVYCVPSLGQPGFMDSVRSWRETASEEYSMHICMGKQVVPAMQECYESTHEEILAYIQDDVLIFEKGWDKRVLDCFADPRVGLVGFGGALGHGRPELYRVSYHLPNLARQDFMSNMHSAEKHGMRFSGVRDVAVIDGFAGFVRRKVLTHWHRNDNGPAAFNVAGGFPFGVPVGYFMVWENLCCEVRRQGYRIQVCGVECEHIGGRSSSMHGAVHGDYEAEHGYFYDHNRDVMPYRVKE